MKKILFASLLCVSLLGISTITTQAVTNNGEKERGHISLSTSADMEISPDVAEISFAVRTSDSKSIQKATANNKEISDKLYSALKGMINSTNGDYVKTANFNACPIYSYHDKKRVLDRYEVNNRVIVHTKSLDKIGAMIDKSIELGATNVDSLNFSISNYESQCNSLIEKATKKATTRAQIAAKASNTVLDGVHSMDISCSENGTRTMPRMYMAKNMLASVADGVAESAPSTSISEGAIKIYANVNVSYYVK